MSTTRVSDNITKQDMLALTVSLSSWLGCHTERGSQDFSNKTIPTLKKCHSQQFSMEQTTQKLSHIPIEMMMININNKIVKR